MIATATAAMEPLPFEVLGSDTLLDRVDTKYLLPVQQIPPILSEILGEYRVLTYGGRAVSRYQTRYFDTPDFRLYRDHRIGRVPRAKVRLRSYLDSDVTFLELKWKTPKGRTVKVRERFRGDWDAAIAAFGRGVHWRLAGQIPWQDLDEVATIEYDRVTLLHRGGSERVTVDLNLASHHGERRISHSRIAIIEVKQARINRGGITSVLRRRRIREAALSKYCFSVAQLHPGVVKTHEYHGLIDRVNRLEAAGLPTLVPG